VAKPEESDRDRRRREAQEREARAAALRPLKQEIDKVEARIAELEAEMRVIQPQLADPVLFNDFQRSRPLMHRYGEVQAELEQLYARWEKLQETLAARS